MADYFWGVDGQALCNGALSVRQMPVVLQIAVDGRPNVR